MRVQKTANHMCSPPSAIRLLEDMVHLKEGDVVVQNGANSIVGQVVILLTVFQPHLEEKQMRFQVRHINQEAFQNLRSLSCQVPPTLVATPACSKM